LRGVSGQWGVLTSQYEARSEFLFRGSGNPPAASVSNTPMELNRELPDAFFSWRLVIASLTLGLLLSPFLERALERWTEPPQRAQSEWNLRTMWH